MNQNIPPPHEGTPAQAAPNGDIMPATAPATRSNGRLILGTVVLLVLIGALGYGFWQHYSLHAEVIATADQRHDFVRPSSRPISMPAPVATSPSAPSISAAGSRPEICWWRSRRLKSNTRSRRPKVR
jgi:hypothetical protein